MVKKQKMECCKGWSHEKYINSEGYKDDIDYCNKLHSYTFDVICTYCNYYEEK